MADRILKILLPQAHTEAVLKLLENEALDLWQEERAGGQLVISVLSDKEQTEKITDLLRQHFEHVDGFRIIVQSVEAVISPFKSPPEPDAAAKTDPAQKKEKTRVSREELYHDVIEGARFSNIFLVMTALSTVVAAIGLLGDNVAVIIGAMVIAPLLGPNVGLALAATLADTELAKQAGKTFLAGILVAFCLSFVTGVIWGVDPAIGEIAGRTRLGLTDIILALASGCAGVLAFTTGASGTLIGVMVAVALLPPLAVCGMLFGIGQYGLGAQALLLFGCNVICVNLAGILTFLLQGIRPRTWWETTRAKRATRLAITLWSTILVVLIGIIFLIR